MSNPANTRWLALGVVALLGVSTAVAAVRNSDDDEGRPGPAATGTTAQPAPGTSDAVPESEAAVPAPMGTDEDPAGEQASAAPRATPGAVTPVRVGDRSTVRRTAMRVRIGDRTTRTTPVGVPPGPATAEMGAPTMPSMSPPAAPLEENDPGGAGQEPSGGESDSAMPPDPEATPAPPPATLIDATAAVRLEPVRFLIRVESDPAPAADVTIGEDPVVGDAPPAERTEVGVGGELVPFSRWAPVAPPVVIAA